MLTRYDGEQWESIDLALDQPLDGITALAFDATGTLWIGAHNALVRYQGGVATRVPVAHSPLAYWSVAGLAPAPEGGMWINLGRGLAYFDGSSWHAFSTFPTGRPFASIGALAVDASGQVWIGEHDNLYTLRFSEQPTVTEIPERPAVTYFSSVYPNPFRSAAQIAFTLPEPMPVRLTVYDALGREVAVLADGKYGPGRHTITFDAGEQASGLYLYRLVTPRGAEAGRIVRVR